MTRYQVIALIVICASIAGLVAYAYWLGRKAGQADGCSASDARHKATIQGLEAAFEALQRKYQNLVARTELLGHSSDLQQKARSALLCIAETLRLAADTWKAFKTGKKLERDARRQRNQALALAEAFKPTEQGPQHD